MTLTETVIRECIAKGITQKRTIAREICKQDPTRNLNSARTTIQRMLGGGGRELSVDNVELYNLYKKASGGSDHYEVATRKELKVSKTYIITTALNNTPIHEQFWENILAYARYKRAEIHVVAERYKNPTSVFTDKDEDVWCSQVLPYLDAKRHILFPGIHLMSDVKISPTAVTPLSELSGMSGSESCIFGHPRVHMQFVPVPKGDRPKKMMTTGVCTLPNYTDSKTGKKGEFHHTFGFVIANEEGFHYVKAKANGDFIDYDTMVEGGVVCEAPPVEALIFGDIHWAKLTMQSRNRIMGRILYTGAKKVILHDVMDCESVNPHDEKNPIKKVKKYEGGRSDLEWELDGTLSFLKDVARLCEKVYVVRSNHDDMLDRYIASMDWRKDIPNAVKYAELLPIALREEGVFPYLANKIGVIATKLDDSVKVMGIELNIHGDKGANGSKGSAVQFKNLSSKVVIGHGHSPFCFDGASGVGCQDTDHGYNEGFSSWAVGDITINVFGKTQHIF